MVPSLTISRQTRQKKAKKQQLLAKGYTEEHVYKMLKPKAQPQENHKNCGSDFDTLNDEWTVDYLMINPKASPHVRVIVLSRVM